MKSKNFLIIIFIIFCNKILGQRFDSTQQAVIKIGDSLIFYGANLKSIKLKSFPDSFEISKIDFVRFRLLKNDTVYRIKIPSNLKNEVYQIYGKGYNNKYTRPKLIRVFTFNPKKINIAAWGLFFSGETDFTNHNQNLIHIAGGEEFVITLNEEAKIEAFGRNTNNESNYPKNLTQVVDISGGWTMGMALTKNCQVFVWGDTTFGQQIIPTNLKDSIISIHAGGYYCSVIKENGKVVVWGAKDNNNFPAVDFGQRNVPSNIGNVEKLGCRGEHVLALTSNGRLVSWGNNDSGQATIPYNLPNVWNISGGWKFSYAISKKDSSVIPWGESVYKALDTPVNLKQIIKIDGGDWHGLALTKEGKIYQWGGDFTPIPVIYNLLYPIPSLDNVVNIAAGDYSSYALYQIFIKTAVNDTSYGYITETQEIKSGDDAQIQIFPKPQFYVDSIIINDTMILNSHQLLVNLTNVRENQKIKVVFNKIQNFIIDLNLRKDSQIKCINNPHFNLYDTLFIKIKEKITFPNNFLDSFHWFQSSYPNIDSGKVILNSEGVIKSLDTTLFFIPNKSKLGRFYYYVKFTNSAGNYIYSDIAGPFIIIDTPSFIIQNSANSTSKCILDKELDIEISKIKANSIRNRFYTSLSSMANVKILQDSFLYLSDTIFKLNLPSNLAENTIYTLKNKIIDSLNCSSILPDITVYLSTRLNLNSPNSFDTFYCKNDQSKAITINSQSYFNHLKYFWYKSTISNSNLILNNAENFYYPPTNNVADTQLYFVSACDTIFTCSCDTLFSPFTVNIIYPKIIIQPAQSIYNKCIGQEFNPLKIAVSDFWQPLVNYKWFRLIREDTTRLFKNENTITPKENTIDSFRYFCVVNSLNLCPNLSDTSLSSGLNILLPEPLILPIQDTLFCYNDSFKTISAKLNYLYKDKVYYQWYKIDENLSNLWVPRTNKQLTNSYSFTNKLELSSYNILVTNNEFCQDTSNVFIVKITNFPNIIIDTLYKKQTYFGTNNYPIIIQANVGELSISPAEYARPNVFFPGVIVDLFPPKTENFLINFYDSLGCFYQKSFLLNVDTEVFIDIYPKKIISPNADGINENWTILNIEYFPNNEIIIYNRLNQVVKTFKNFNNLSNWNGFSSTGSPLPNGQYFYFIRCFKNNQEVIYKKGYFIIRSN